MYVLILMFMAGYGPHINTTMQEFSSLASCKKAENIVRVVYDNSRWDKGNLLVAQCEAK